MGRQGPSFGEALRSSRSVAVTQLDSRTLQLIVKEGGKVTHTIHVVISRDGKTITQTDDGVNEKGQKVHDVVVAEKQ